MHARTAETRWTIATGTMVDPHTDDSRVPREDSRTALPLRIRKDAIWAAVSRSAPRSETRLGRFRVLGQLGTGGMGVVFEAYDDTLERRVAIKVLHHAGEERHRARLLREAQALAQLSHPHVVQVYEVGEVDDRLFIAMELVAGVTLLQWQRERRPWPRCLELYRQAALGLAAAHARGLVHRDFKPANCIVDDEGRVKVLDFGLVRGVEDTSSNLDATSGDEARSASTSGPRGALGTPLTRTGAAMGTPAYMAPEQLRGGTAQHASDQFSLCASLFEALHGVRPFMGSTRVAILYAIEHRRWTSPQPAPGLPPVPPWLRRTVERGLSTEPADRFPSMDALLDALEPPRRRWPWLMGGIAALGLAGGLRATSRPEPCVGLRQAPVPGWSAAERDAVEAALRRALPERADTDFPRLRTDLDGWADRWAQTRAQACEQTRVYQAADEDLLERRNACLERQRQRLVAIVEVLSEADAPAAAHAIQAARSLPAPEPCLDAQRLRTGPRSLPPALAEAEAEIRERLALSWASDAAGRPRQGIALAEQAVEHAAALGPDAEPLHAETLYARGRLLRAMRRLDEARTDLEAALRRAERVDDQGLTVDALRELVGVAALEGNASAAHAWRTALAGKLERMADDPRMEAEIAYLEGQAALRRKQPREAEVALRRAVEAYTALGPASAVERLHAQIRLAWALDRQGLRDDALAAHREGLAVARREGLLLMEALLHEELGEFHLDHGDLEQAEHHGRTALELREPVYGRRTPVNADALRNLAELLRRQGRIDEAVEVAEDARRSLDSTTSPSRQANVHQLTASLHRQRGDWDAALGAYRDARAELLRIQPVSDVKLAMLDSNVADCQMMKGQLDEAEAGYGRALAVLEAHTEPDDPRRVFPLLGLGHILLERGQLEDALTPYRSAWEIQRELGHNPELSAVLQWELGRTLVDADRSPAEHGEGLTLVQRARDAFERSGATEMLEQLDRWREACGPRCRP